MLFLQVQQRFRDMQALQRKRVSATDNFYQNGNSERQLSGASACVNAQALKVDAALFAPTMPGYAGWLEQARFYNAVSAMLFTNSYWHCLGPSRLARGQRPDDYARQQSRTDHS